VKADSYVLETNVHYPTDVNLLYDSGRKCLDMIVKASRALDKPLAGWRKAGDWHKRLRKQERRLTTILGRGGKNRQARLEAATRNYLETARKISAKIEASRPFWPGSPKMLAISVALEQYRSLLEKHIDLVRRRLLEGETIPHADKLFSIFEQHTQWINKGKKHKKVELGLNVLIATDQYHFILHHQVMQDQQDVQLAVPLARTICQTYQQDQFDSISFDRGFFSQLNYENLQAYAHQVILPKKGKLTQPEQQRESHQDFVNLRHQHSAVEANINQLEHHGLNRCPDKGLRAFKRYTAFGVLAYNLHRLGKVLIQLQQAKGPRKKAA